MSRMWHKVNFLSGVYPICIQSFSSRLVTIVVYPDEIRSQTLYIYIYIYIQSNTNAKNRRKQANTHTGGLCCFRYQRFIDLLTSVLRHEERDTILKSLCQPYYANHLRRLRPEKLNRRPNRGKLNSLPPWFNLNCLFFQNPQILRTISSGHDVIYTPAPFPVWGFIMTMVIVISFAHERKTVPNDYAPELLTRIVPSPTKLNDKIN